MAFTATTYWEVQTGGNDANGGGFDSAASGTDYSYGAGQTTIAYTDIVIGVTTTQGTSVARAFVAADVGNILNVTSGTGFTVQRVQVASVAGGTATFDKSLGTTGSIGGTGTLGGALASPGQAAGLIVAGNRVYIKSGTYQIGTGTQNTAGNKIVTAITGTGTTQFLWQGYGTTRADSGTAPILQNNGNTATNIFDSSGAQGVTIDNITVDGNSGATMSGFKSGQGNILIRCKALNCPTTGFLPSGSVTDYDYCEATACGNGWSGRANCRYCTSHANTVSGFTTASGASTLYHCISYANTGPGFVNGGTTTYYNGCTSYGNSTYGFNTTASGNTPLSIVDCIAYNNTTKDFNWDSNNQNHMRNCAYGTIAGTVVNEAPQVLTADPFVNSGGGNFVLNNTIGGGNLARSSTNPTFMGSTTTTYQDIGAVQHQDTTAIYPIMD